MTTNDPIAIILAAGQGTRMKSDLPKVLHTVAHRSMIGHVLDAAASAGLSRRIVVTGPGMENVAKEAEDLPGKTQYVIQKERLGTGHAVMTAREALAGHEGAVFVLFGDMPLLQAQTITAMADSLGGNDIAVLGFRPSNAAGYGRLLLDGNGALEAIREDRDATPAERQTKFCFSGLMAFASARTLALLDRIEPNNRQGEFYLTDVIEIARGEGLRIVTAEANAEDVMPANTRGELAEAEMAMQVRLRARAMAGGTTMQDPASVYMAYDTHLAADVTLEPHIVFGPKVTVESGAIIRAFSHLEACTIGQNAQIGPYARLRPGAEIGQGAKVGNFVEIKKSTVGPGAKVNHLSYIGDTKIGPRANIGAGSITCNYDGFKKWQTTIGEGAFIGSNSALVAPVRIGDGAFVATGSVVTADVEDDAMVVARARQEIKPGWAKRFRAKFAKPKG